MLFALSKDSVEHKKTSNLTPKQVHMFRKITFGHFLSVKLVFNGPFCHYILLREVEDKRDDVILVKLHGQKATMSEVDWASP